MRFRTFMGFVTGCIVAGGVVSVASASAHQVMAPMSVTPTSVTPTSVTPTSVTPTSVTPTSVTGVVAAETTAPCPPNVASSVVGSLPKLGADLQSAWSAYATNPSGTSVGAWMDSGGSFGGGVPASAVRTLMRRGLASGLTDEQVRAFLQPGFLRGMSDPRGGASLFDFIGQQTDPTFLGQLASCAGTMNGREMSWMSAQSGVFDAFPFLRAAYMSQAGAIPPDLETAGQMLSLANQGYRPAQETIQAFLARGNHPSAGAQNAGGVADGCCSAVYDGFVANYTGPLSPGAAAAVANRIAYNAWVDRIATWADVGAPMTGCRTRRSSPPRQRLLRWGARCRPASHPARPPRHGTGPSCVSGLFAPDGALASRHAGRRRRGWHWWSDEGVASASGRTSVDRGARESIGLVVLWMAPAARAAPCNASGGGRSTSRSRAARPSTSVSVGEHHPRRRRGTDGRRLQWEQRRDRHVDGRHRSGREGDADHQQCG